MNEEKQEKLFMSVKVPDQNDFIQGFGSRELAVTMTGGAIALVLLMLVFSITGNLAISIASTGIFIVAIVLVVRRDICNESLLDKTRQVYRYYKNRKRYFYCYYDSVKEEGKETNG